MSDTFQQLEFEFLPPKLPELLTVDEVFERLDQRLLESLKEDQRIERKPPDYIGEHLGEYICMWANTSRDGGIIVLGIADGGQIMGCHDLSHNQLNSVDKAQDLCADSRCEIKRIPVQLPDGKSSYVIAIRVHY